jgi:hypothetical protein
VLFPGNKPTLLVHPLSPFHDIATYRASNHLPGIPLFTAKFNRHTGAFARVDARDPSHLSEHERAKRMSQFYFDVDQWQDDLAKHGGSIKGPAGAGASEEWEDDGEGGRKRKRPTKKDMEMYKEKKKQKKLAKTAWLRN